MKRIVLLLCCLAITPLGAQAGKLYRWVDAQGTVHYGDAPPPDAVRVEKKRLTDSVAPVEELPYETRRALENFPVVLYVADNCTQLCDQARSLLSERGIPYSEKKLQTQPDIDAFKALSGSDITPTLGVGKSFLKGFLATQWHSELDFAGYPKKAPYRAPRQLPVSPPPAASQVAPPNSEALESGAPEPEAPEPEALQPESDEVLAAPPE